MFKYLIDGEEVTREEFEEELETAVTDEVEEGLDDIIDDIEEEIEIGSLSFSPSEVLKELDPVAYRCYACDEESYRLEEYRYDLERFGEVIVNNTTFELIEEEEEEEEE